MKLTWPNLMTLLNGVDVFSQTYGVFGVGTVGGVHNVKCRLFFNNINLIHCRGCIFTVRNGQNLGRNYQNWSTVQQRQVYSWMRVWYHSVCVRGKNAASLFITLMFINR